MPQTVAYGGIGTAIRDGQYSNWEGEMAPRNADEPAVPGHVYEVYAKDIFEANLDRFWSPKRISFTMKQLERFIDDIRNTDEIPFVRSMRTPDTLSYDGSPLAHSYFRELKDFVFLTKRLSPSFQYNPRIEIFREECNALGLYDIDLDWSNIHIDAIKKRPQFHKRTAADVFNELVLRLRSRTKNPEFRRKVYEQRRGGHDTFINYCAYVDALFRRYSRLIVIRVDFGYQPEYRSMLTPEMVKADLAHLLGNEKGKPSIFKGKVGYIAKLEDGVVKGLHFHAIYFFHAGVRDGRSHVYLAQKLGEYWRDIATKGRGDYWNCNQDHKDYLRKGILGVGVISHGDQKLRHNLHHRVLAYLCKSSQYFRPKFGDGRVRSIQRGELPQIETRGRKRKFSSASVSHKGVNIGAKI